MKRAKEKCLIDRCPDFAQSADSPYCEWHQPSLPFAATEERLGIQPDRKRPVGRQVTAAAQGAA